MHSVYHAGRLGVVAHRVEYLFIAGMACFLGHGSNLSDSSVSERVSAVATTLQAVGAFATYCFVMAGAASLALPDQIGRFGVFYVRTLLAQGGVIHNEPSSGEDHLAVDITANFQSGACCVQVKTGTRSLNKDGCITVPVAENWKVKWAANVLPVYLVYVHLESGVPTGWASHEGLQTVVHANALWIRVNEFSGKSVRLPVENQLTADTFDLWADEFANESAWGKAARA